MQTVLIPVVDCLRVPQNVHILIAGAFESVTLSANETLQKGLRLSWMTWEGTPDTVSGVPVTRLQEKFRVRRCDDGSNRWCDVRKGS